MKHTAIKVLARHLAVNAKYSVDDIVVIPGSNLAWRVVSVPKRKSKTRHDGKQYRYELESSGKVCSMTECYISIWGAR